MSARTANSFFASAALHAVLAALVIWFTWSRTRVEKDGPPIFEMVAGEGDNYAATEAPALGVPGGIKLEIPEPPAPAPSPVVEAQPEASPIIAEPSPVEPVRPAPKPVQDYKPVNMAKMVDRIADKRAANIEKKFKAEQERAAKAEAAAAASSKPMTKAEFDRLNQNRSLAAQKGGTPGGAGSSLKKIDSEGIAKGVAGGSTSNKTGGAGGTALTRQEVELNDAYISLLIQRLKQAHQKPDGLSDLLQATVKFRLTASGAVTNVSIVSSSRNAEFDQSVLAAFRRISLPPPPPNLKTSDYTITFKMREDD